MPDLTMNQLIKTMKLPVNDAPDKQFTSERLLEIVNSHGGGYRKIEHIDENSDGIIDFYRISLNKPIYGYTGVRIEARTDKVEFSSTSDYQMGIPLAFSYNTQETGTSHDDDPCLIMVQDFLPDAEAPAFDGNSLGSRRLPTCSS